MEKLAVRRTPSNYQEVNDFFSKLTTCKFTNRGVSEFQEGGVYKKQEFNFIHYPAVRNSNSGLSYFKRYLVSGYKEVSLEEFKKIHNMEEKKIIGYNLKALEYKQAALIISKCENCGFVNDYRFINGIISGSVAERQLRKAGVLDLWFTPVYYEKVMQYEISPFINIFFKEGYFGFEKSKINIPISGLRYIINKINSYFSFAPGHSCTVETVSIHQWNNISLNMLKQAYAFYQTNFEK